MSAIIAALQMCLTPKCIIAWGIVGVVVGFISWVVREVVTDCPYTLIGHLIVGLLGAFLGLLVAITGRFQFEPISIPAIAISVLGAIGFEVIVGPALPPRR